MTITPEFTILINDWNGTDAFPPFNAPEHLGELLKENYSADEDRSFTSIPLTDLEAVIEVIDLYKCRDVHFSLHCTVKNEQVYLSASIDSKRRSLSTHRVSGEMRLHEPKEMPLKLAAEKLRAIAIALELGEKKGAE